MWFLAYCAAVLVVAIIMVTSLDHFWRKCQRLECEAVQLRSDLVAAKQDATEWASLVALLQDTNYRLACSLYGRRAVDGAIAEAHKRGVC